MRLHALTIVAACGCTTSQEPYEVDAVARLAPVGTPGVRVTGPIEILGIGAPGPDVAFVRTVAAYHVQLPAGAAPWVRLYEAASCAPEPAPALFEDLGTIRRVGDEAHFFARDIRVGDRTVDIDTGTVTAAVALDGSQGSVFGMIAVVQAPGDGATTIETSSRNPVPIGGAWLACGTFATP